MEKFKKIDKPFLLSDSSVNSYGFRLLTEGYLKDEYQKNPIGFHMHGRDAGVLVKWDDLTVDGDKVFGKPVINMSNSRAQQTIDEIENGFLNAASMGHFVVLEFSDDPALKLPNQTGPTVTKWFNRECSLVDIPGNFNALALFDKDENPINLADFTKPKIEKNSMKQIFFTAAQIAAMNLKADAEDSAVNVAFNNLVAKAAEADGLKTKNNELTTEISNLKAEAETKEISGLTQAALAAGKVTKEVADQLATAYKGNATGLKNLIDAMPVHKSIADSIDKGKGGNDKFAALMAKSWDDLFASGETEVLRKGAPDLYKQKFKEEFGTDPK